MARAALAELAPQLPAALLQKLSLIASELVTNSLRHAQTPDPAPSMTVEVTAAQVKLTVHDNGESFDLDPVSAQPGVRGGWGLKLVDSLADRWRIERAAGTRVVCELDRPR